jgi:UDP-N-acetylglucosamine 2-epimerase (non-hydrolysing)
MTTDSHLTTGTRGKLFQGNMNQSGLVLVLGIRPDVIRASIMIRELRLRLGNNFKLVWSGQHYSDNLKDVFFRELDIDAPDVELGISGSTDAELVASMISELSKFLVRENPKAVIFLGDTNTVTGTIAAGQLNIPVVHIEGCMRSYDWRMPEEKYRTVADHLSDVVYAYLDEYKAQGLAEGIPTDNIVVTGNPIVDVLEEFFISGKLRMGALSFEKLLKEKYNVAGEDFLLMTCHRRENVENEFALQNILDLAGTSKSKVLFPAGYRTQKMLLELNISVPANVFMVDPIGYLELLELMTASKGILTDSGTIVEEAAVLGVPSIQMRTATERPQVYECGASIKFNPFELQDNGLVIEKLNRLRNQKWKHPFGDGKASYRIVDDLISRYECGNFSGHQAEKFLPYSAKSFMSDT